MLKRPLRPDLRKDGVRERLPDLHKGTSHSAYAWLRRVKEGQLPSKRLNIRKALDAVEVAIIEHFGEMNALQQVQLNLLRPFLVFWMLHPAIMGTSENSAEGDNNENLRISSDFLHAHNKIEQGLQKLCDLGKSQPNNPKLTLTEILKQHEEKK
jgi:hypothetical protein